MKKISLFIWLALLTAHLTAQRPDTVVLAPVSIQEARLQQMSGVNQHTLDSLTMELIEPLSLSEALSANSPVFIKSYGQGALSTSSFRGAGASHTQVLWNGVNVNSPTLGQVDFALVPMNFVDKLTLLNGGNSVYSTSGGFGGSIHLDNTANWKDTLSFGLNQTFSDILSSKTGIRNNLILGKSLLLNTRIMYINSRNEYTYKNNFRPGPPYPEETQYNAGYSQSGIMEDIYLKINENNMLTARFWAQQNFREIPRPLTVKDMGRNEEQDNDFLRAQLAWESRTADERWLLRTAWLDENYRYRNPVSALNLSNNSKLWSTHGAYKFYISEKANLETGANIDLYQVESSAYADKFERNHLSFFAKLWYNPWKRLSGALIMRSEKIDNSSVKLLPSASLQLEILKAKKLVLKANASRNYHHPTMNDLYWSPGGNPNLEAEEGNSYEGGLHYLLEKKEKGLSLKLSGTYFYSDIRNWILWQPDSVASFWTPSNLKNVVSQGLESSLQFTKKWPDALLRLSMQYNYTSTKNKKALVAGDASVNKQLIYVPEHTAGALLFGNYRNWRLMWQYHYTGKRYTASDNSRYMPAFMLHDLEIGYRFNWGKPQLTASLRADNLLNTPYQSVAWYPMPGRVLIVKISFQWKK